MNLTHVAAGQLAISSSTDHVGGDKAAPPVTPGAGRVTDHREKGLLQDVGNRTSSFRREQSFQIQGCSQDHLKKVKTRSTNLQFQFKSNKILKGQNVLEAL